MTQASTGLEEGETEAQVKPYTMWDRGVIYATGSRIHAQYLQQVSDMWRARQRTASLAGETRAGGSVGKNSGFSCGWMAKQTAEPQSSDVPHSPKQMLCVCVWGGGS